MGILDFCKKNFEGMTDYLNKVLDTQPEFHLAFLVKENAGMTNIINDLNKKSSSFDKDIDLINIGLFNASCQANSKLISQFEAVLENSNALFIKLLNAQALFLKKEMDDLVILEVLEHQSKEYYLNKAQELKDYFKDKELSEISLILNNINKNLKLLNN